MDAGIPAKMAKIDQENGDDAVSTKPLTSCIVC